jgi:hypothetical protein
LILVGISIFLTFKNPKFGVITIIILMSLRDTFLLLYFPVMFVVLHLPLVFGILTILSLLFHKNEYSFPISFQFWLMLLFFVIICLSRFVAQTEIFANKVPGEFIRICILFFLIVHTIKSEKDLNHVIWSLILANTFSVLYHYYNYKIGSWQSIFATSSYQTLDRNGYAATLLSLCPLAYFTIKTNKERYKKIILAFCFLSFIAGVILTDSRGGALSLGITKNKTDWHFINTRTFI